MSKTCVNKMLLANEELLDSHMGSVHINSNLYVEGFVFQGRYGGCSNPVTIDVPYIFEKSVTFCNDLHLYTSNIQIYNELLVGACNVIETQGAPIVLNNESVFAKQMVVDELKFSTQFARAPVFPNVSLSNWVYDSNVYTDSSAIYDNSWRLSIDPAHNSSNSNNNNNNSNNSNNGSGVFLGNGKIGMLSKVDHFGAETVYLTVQPIIENGSYKNNVIETFNPTSIQVLNNTDASVEYICQRQTLDMNTAILTNQYQVQSKNHIEILSIEQSMYVARHLPFCIVQSFKISTDFQVPFIDFFHELVAPPSLRDVDFNNSLVNHDEWKNVSVYMLTGRGTNDHCGAVTCVSSYVFENQDEYYFDNLGFNFYRRQPNKCFNKFRIARVDGTGLEPGKIFTVHILSTLMSAFDFEKPIDEVKRINMSIIANKVRKTSLYPARDFVNSMIDVRAHHVKRWNDLWKGSVNICPQCSASNEEKIRVSTLRRTIRFCFYNIYSCIRENMIHAVNPTALPILDIHGHFLHDGDVWLVPLLTFFHPEIVRVLLEYRAHEAQKAVHLAASYGFRGFKYPFQNDILGYKNALYWDPYNSITVFNTALVAINTWNYFRSTFDKEWLISTGYTILKGVADFIISVAEKDEHGLYHIRNVSGMGLQPSEDNNSFTNTVAKLALKYCVEASYYLSYHVRDSWLEVAEMLPVHTYTLDKRNVVKFDATSYRTHIYTILEPLFVLLPNFSKLFFSPDNQRPPSTYEQNIKFYQTKMEANFGSHPYNIGILTFLDALSLQNDDQHVSIFEQSLFEFIKIRTGGAWGNFCAFDTSIEEPTSHIFDLSQGALFLLILIQGICGLEIKGGVSETKFLYEDMNIQGRVCANMPSYWRDIQICKVGPKQTNFRILNTNIQ